MNQESIVGVVVAVVIGGIVRGLGLPIPAPPTLTGALMVLGLTVGYLAVDFFVKR